MSDAHDAQAVKAAVRKYLIIFGALIVGTVVTVLVSFVHFGAEGDNTINILVGLVIASVKAFLVAGYFMHLMSERKMIYAILIATVFFFASLMYLTIWSMEPVNLIHYVP
jgi:cytochrome c oxidase subunit IV